MAQETTVELNVEVWYRDRLVARKPIGSRGVSVGRDPHNQIVLSDRSVSKHHARIALDNDQVVITDLQSTTGTFVRGERAWLVYRHDSCAAESSAFAGGSFAPVSAAICILDRSKAHLRDLLAMRKTLSFH